MKVRRSLILVVAALAALTLLAGCGGGHLLSRDDEIKMGREAGDDLERKEGLETDPHRRTLVVSVGQRIARAAVPPDYPYDYRVLRGKTVNACAFPGGRIYIWRGLMDLVHNNPDMIAWVLGHETAHVARRHVTRRLEKALGFDAIITLIFRKEGAREIAGVAAGLVLRDYGRDQEFEADRWGLKYSHDAGFDPTAAIAVLEKFRELQKHEPSNLEILFATHPGNNDRINAVKAYLNQQGWRGKYWRP